MYNERKDGFSIKDIIVQLLFIVLFVFILIWLFPTKDSLRGKDNNSNIPNFNFDVLTNRIFNDNLQTMKEAAINYYTNERLPKNINDVKSMTLSEMLKEKLLIEFKDANNKSCDKQKSYVQITKLKDEYLLKVNLTCTDNDAYILVHLGCYDYCDSDVCEKKDSKPSTPIVNPKPTPVPSKPQPKPQPVCNYKYEKKVSEKIWSDWSSWSTTEVTETDTKKVEKKEETESYKENVLVGNKKITTRKPITENVNVQTSSVSVKYCKTYGSAYTETGKLKYQWVDQGTSYYNAAPQPDAYTKYVYVGSTTIDCGDCYNGILYIYRKYTLKVLNEVYKDEVCKEYGTLTAPIYITVPKIIDYEITEKYEPVYEMQTKTRVIKYYRYKTATIKTNVLVKWSSSKNDTNLINQGYKYISSVCK